MTSPGIVPHKIKISRKTTTEEWIGYAVSVHGTERYGYQRSVYVNSRVRVEIFCNECRKFFWQDSRRHLDGKGCLKCGNKKAALSRSSSTESFIERAIEIHGSRYSYSESVYLGIHEKVKIWCPVCNAMFYQEANTHLKGGGCIRCARIEVGKNKSKNTKSFVQKARRIHGDRYTYNESVYLGIHEKIEIGCPACGGAFWKEANQHLKGAGCPTCTAQKLGRPLSIDTEEFIRLAKIVHGEKYTYSKSIYAGSVKKLKINCAKCGNLFSMTPDSHLSGIGCPVCRIRLIESAGAILTKKTLVDFGINFEVEKTFDDCRNENKLRFDFWLSDFNALIEYNGSQHYQVVRRWGGEEGLKIRQRRDQIKRDFCQKNGIRLLEIRYDCKDIQAEICGFLGIPQTT